VMMIHLLIIINVVTLYDDDHVDEM
jgi:hypothetical protein